MLITHEHMDHVNVGEGARPRSPPTPVCGCTRRSRFSTPLGDLGDQAIAVHGGESLMVAGFDVQTFGDQHAVIHPLVPVVANVGYLIGGSVFHPGDSLVVPPFDVELLLLPAMAPWAKISEIIDYAVAARAPKIRPIHDFLVKDVYFGILLNTLKPIVERVRADLRGVRRTRSVSDRIAHLLARAPGARRAQRPCLRDARPARIRHGRVSAGHPAVGAPGPISSGCVPAASAASSGRSSSRRGGPANVR